MPARTRLDKRRVPHLKKAVYRCGGRVIVIDVAVAHQPQCSAVGERDREAAIAGDPARGAAEEIGNGRVFDRVLRVAIDRDAQDEGGYAIFHLS